MRPNPIWALDVITRLCSYTEASPSGCGFHILLRGAKPGAKCNLRFDDGTAFEIYDRSRYFTVTGNHFPSSPLEVREVTDDVLAGVVAGMEARLPKKADPPTSSGAQRIAAPVTLDDDELLRRMLRARNGDLLARLYNGEHGYKSPSDADLALCGALAFWTGKDRVQMDRLFRASALMRDKWDSARGESTCGANTIGRACESSRDTYTGPPSTKGASMTGNVVPIKRTEPKDGGFSNGHATGDPSSTPADPDDTALFARIESFATIASQAPYDIPWDIPGMLPSDEAPAILFGPPSATKSWHLKHLCHCAATGDRFLGRFPVRKRPTSLYI